MHDPAVGARVTRPHGWRIGVPWSLVAPQSTGILGARGCFRLFVVPRRTNTFQDVVAIVQRHMAEGATVEESDMVTPTRGGERREVDVTIRSTVAGHGLCVAVEASKTRRPATVEWVERMIGKHVDLPTDKLVLYSGAGFTKGAAAKAAAHNVAIVAAEEMTDTDREAAVLGGLRSIWPKTYSLSPTRARVWVERPDGSTVWFKAPEDIALFGEDGVGLEPNLRKAVMDHLQRQNPMAIAEQIGLRDITEDVESDFVALWRPVVIEGDEQQKDVFVRYEEADPVELHRVVQVVISGRAVINVSRVDLTHARLGDTAVSYGDVTLAGNTGLLVATGTQTAGAITFRFPEASTA